MIKNDINLQKLRNAIDECNTIKLTGKVTQVVGLVIETQGPSVSVGELCYISSKFPNVPPIPAEVVGFREGFAMLMAIGEMQGIGPGCEVVAAQKMLQVRVGEELLRKEHGISSQSP